MASLFVINWTFLLQAEIKLDNSGSTEVTETPPTNYRFEYCTHPNRRAGEITVV